MGESIVAQIGRIILILLDGKTKIWFKDKSMKQSS